MLYTLTYPLTPHTKALWVRSVDAAQGHLIPGVKDSTLNEGWLRFKPVTSCHASSDNHVKEPTQPKT